MHGRYLSLAAWGVLACSVTSRAAAGPAVETPDEPPVETLVEPPEERYLRWLLLGERPQDAPREAPYVLSQLDGPAPEAAARIIREVLLDKENSADFGICAEAIEKYEAYDEARHLRRFVVERRNRLESDPEDTSYRGIGCVTVSIALLGCEHVELAELCRGDAHAALAALYPPDGSPVELEQVDFIFVDRLLETLWLSGVADDLRELRESARKWKAAFEDRFPSVAYDVELSENGGLSYCIRYVGAEPSEADERRYGLDSHVAEACDELLGLMRTRREAEAKEPPERWDGIASFLFASQEQCMPHRWASLRLRRHVSREERSQAVREALYEAIDREPEYADAGRNVAYKWLTKYGDGLTESEQKDCERILAERRALSLP